MAGSAASETIFFIGAVIVATGLVGAFAATMGDLSGGVEARGKSFSRGLQSDIVIINDPLNVTTSPLTVFAKNTGTATLYAALTNLFLDGQLAASPTYDVLGTTDDSLWHPGEVLKITTTEFTIGTGDHRLRVVAETGFATDLEFRIT